MANSMAQWVRHQTMSGISKCKALINGGQAQEARVQSPAWEPGSIG